MALLISKFEFFKYVEQLSRYRIKAAEFGRKVSAPPRAITDTGFIRAGRRVLQEYLGMEIMEYRYRGFQLSLALGCPILKTSIQGLHIPTAVFLKILAAQGKRPIDYPANRFILWTFKDVYDNRHYVLHLMYGTDREPDFIPFRGGEHLYNDYPIEPGAEKRVQRFIDWLAFYA